MTNPPDDTLKKLRESERVDEFILKITVCWEQRKTAAIEDGVSFEKLMLDHLEFGSEDYANCDKPQNDEESSTSRNTIKSIGLRNRVPPSPEKRDLKVISGLNQKMLSVAHQLKQGLLPPVAVTQMFTKRARLYLNKKISASDFLGEQFRKDRNGNTLLVESTMGGIADEAFERVFSKNGLMLGTSIPDKEERRPNLYWLLADLSEQVLNGELIKNYNLPDTIKVTLDELKDMIYHESDDFDADFIPRILLSRPARWYAAHAPILRVKKKMGKIADIVLNRVNSTGIVKWKVLPPYSADQHWLYKLLADLSMQILNPTGIYPNELLDKKLDQKTINDLKNLIREEYELVPRQLLKSKASWYTAHQTWLNVCKK